MMEWENSGSTSPRCASASSKLFRLRSEHAASIGETMREAIANRLIEQYGSAQGAADATWALAGANQRYREGEHAERFFLRPPLTTEPARNEAALDLIVAWHG